MENNEMKYEDALKKLTEIVNKLEGGDIPLDETIKYYEEGQKLLKFCKEELSVAEGKLKKVTDEGNVEDVV